jgi:hypothetical protein
MDFTLLNLHFEFFFKLKIFSHIIFFTLSVMILECVMVKSYKDIFQLH